MLANEDRILTKEQLKRILKKEKALYSFSRFGEARILRKHIVLLRKCEYHTNAKHSFLACLYRIRLNSLQSKYALHIPVNCCKEGLKIMHLAPVLINGDAVVGKNCIFHMNSAVVAGGTDNGVPILGDDVVMGIGSVALGSITIANGVAVGANAVVNKSVKEENIAVAGVPAKKISNNGRFEWNKKQ